MSTTARIFCMWALLRWWLTGTLREPVVNAFIGLTKAGLERPTLAKALKAEQLWVECVRVETYGENC